MANDKKFDVPNLISHHPATQDELGFDVYADSITHLLSNLTEVNTGLTIGVFGDWGSGKSSLLEMVEAKLRDKSEAKLSDKSEARSRDKSKSPKFLVVRFNPWRYGDQRQVWAALLRSAFFELPEQDRADVDWDVLNFNLWLSRIKFGPFFHYAVTPFLFKLLLIFFVFSLTIAGLDFAFGQPQNSLLGESLKLLREPLKITSITSAILLVLWALFGWLVKVIRSIYEIGIPADFKYTSLLADTQEAIVDQFRRELAIIIKHLGERRRVVVLIDDLDRAAVNQIVPILEAIKHFGEIKKEKDAEKSHAPIAFVLAVDRRVIEKAVASHYKDFWEQIDSKEREHYSREYIEKIVQIPFELPLPPRNTLEKFLLEKSLPSGSDKGPRSLDGASAVARRIFVAGPKENVREVIQAHNTFQSIWLIATDRRYFGAPPETLAKLLAALTLIRYVYPDVFKEFVRYPELLFDLHGIASKKRNSNCVETEIEEMLSLGCPSLNENGDHDDDKEHSSKITVETIRKNYPQVVKICGTFELPEETVDTNRLFSVLSLTNENAPSERYLIEISKALLSGDPSRIKFAARIDPEYIKQDRLLWLTEFLDINVAKEEKIKDARKEKALRAIFALGRLKDPRAIDPLKQIISKRRKLPHSITQRAAFALAHLACSRVDKTKRLESIRSLLDIVDDKRTSFGFRLQTMRLLEKTYHYSL